MRCEYKGAKFSKKYNSYNAVLNIVNEWKSFKNCCNSVLGENMRVVYSSIPWFFNRTGQRQSGKEIVQLLEQLALGMDMGEVEEITDSRGEELTDKEQIPFEETKVSTKTEAEASEKLQECLKVYTTNCALQSIFGRLHTVIVHNLCCQVTMLLAALSLLLACLLVLLFYKDYKTRFRMKLSERIPGPKALPLLGNLLDIGFNSDSKLHMFVYLAIRHERHPGALRHYDLGVAIS